MRTALDVGARQGADGGVFGVRVCFLLINDCIHVSRRTCVA